MGSLGPKSMRMGHGPKPKLHLSAALLALWWLGWELLLKVAVSGRAASFPWKLWELLLVCGWAFPPPPSGRRTLTASRLQGPGCLPTATGYWLGPGKGASTGEEAPCSTSATLEASEGTRQDASLPGEAPLESVHTTYTSFIEVQR